MQIDFAVIGGSFAGLSAALQLARARRQVLVVDAGQRRNRFVDEAGLTSHGFLSQDGRAPAAIAAEGKAQLLRYSSVQWLDGPAESARLAPHGQTGAATSGVMIYVNAGKFLGPVVFANVYALTASYGLSFASMVVPAIFGIYCLARLESGATPVKNEKARIPV